MTRFLCFVFLLAFSVDAFAQTEPPALLITPSGHYFVVLNDQGEPTLVEIKQVIRIGDLPPGDGPDDPAPPVSEVTKQVKEWAEEVNHPVGSQALALIYRTIAEKVNDGSLKPEDAFPAIKQATDHVLPTVQGEGKWDQWRIKVGDLITAKLQKGELVHSRELVNFLNEVGAGLEQSAKAQPALSPEVISMIVALIMRILEMFTATTGPGPV